MPIPVTARSRRKVEEAELHFTSFSLFPLGAAALTRQFALLTLQHHPAAAAQTPQQLQHRDVKRHRRHRQPPLLLPIGTAITKTLVHTAEEVLHIPLLDHHPFRPPRRTRGVDQVSQIVAAGVSWRVCFTFLCYLCPGALEIRLRQHHLDTRVCQHPRQSFTRIRRI